MGRRMKNFRRKYEAVLWTLEKLRKTMFCCKMINFYVWPKKITLFSGNASDKKNFPPDSHKFI